MSSLYKRQISAASEMRLAKRVVHGTSPSVLRSWNQPGVAFAEWTRSWEPSLIGRLDGLALDDLPRARFIARLDRIGDDVASVISQAGNCDATVVAALGSDIESLATRFAQATAARRIEVRLEAICDDACRLFHIDRMKARLVTTYIGPGTEWVHTAPRSRCARQCGGFCRAGSTAAALFGRVVSGLPVPCRRPRSSLTAPRWSREVSPVSLPQ
ncbi:MAG: DUF1826 domain-containing protein [Hyphomicrobium sp.]|nr:DUF1826 domain-containing protein [Hyphomicrobium sp.]